jgi:hypothetical protein
VGAGVAFFGVPDVAFLVGGRTTFLWWWWGVNDEWPSEATDVFLTLVAAVTVAEDGADCQNKIKNINYLKCLLFF